ncbi:hypothetical protein F2P81_003231 [Scophthalmus maximus]|uniref:Uncharacterized protein n=1 Tax=Scophthalmus maximus TaxID=52904 RepID=A0A6A4TDM9_SCOMX|nr:hypothetical protein F2P81_003231 [Scophthalmus maximus]
MAVVPTKEKLANGPWPCFSQPVGRTSQLINICENSPIDGSQLAHLRGNLPGSILTVVDQINGLLNGHTGLQRLQIVLTGAKWECDVRATPVLELFLKASRLSPPLLSQQGRSTFSAQSVHISEGSCPVVLPF